MLSEIDEKRREKFNSLATDEKNIIAAAINFPNQDEWEKAYKSDTDPKEVTWERILFNVLVAANYGNGLDYDPQLAEVLFKLR